MRCNVSRSNARHSELDLEAQRKCRRTAQMQQNYYCKALIFQDDEQKTWSLLRS